MIDVTRKDEQTVRNRLGNSAAVVLLGPRQVGKTTLAQRIATERGDKAIYLDLESAPDLRRLDDADAYLRAQAGKLVVIDEIHRAPELFATLRGVIDERRRKGQRYGSFLLLGSASLDLMQQRRLPRESAGRNRPRQLRLVEMKRSSAPKVGKGFTVACNDLGIAERYVCYPGNERYPLKNGVEVAPLGALMETVSAAAR